MIVEHGFRPGALGRIVALHGAYYAENWGFGLEFESLVAAGIAEFAQRYDPKRDLALCAVSDTGQVEGSLIIDGQAQKDSFNEAKLRWFILSDATRGQGLGGGMMREAIDFADRTGYREIVLDTFVGLDAAVRLYDSFGFRLERESAADMMFGTPVTVQRYRRTRPTAL
ncbi:MAG: GNAT family N-acetyltransferase [Alphaproteobacteria bacterium]|nr:GNAT family N-acetyltransferase [Alphaproteobacteria bacterium]